MSIATTFLPPYPFPGLPSLDGSGGADGLEVLAEEYNLSFVRGDAFSVAFLFVGVCWTPDRPVDDVGAPRPDPPDAAANVLPVAWEQHWWASEIRDPTNHPADPCWYYNGWVPIWGGLPPNSYKTWFEMTKVAEFTCVSTFVDAPIMGTMVTLSLTSEETVLFPGDYRWDLQSATIRNTDPDTDEFVSYGGCQTWKQGTVTVVADYTITPEKV